MMATIKGRWTRWLVLGLAVVMAMEGARRGTTWLYGNSAARPAAAAQPESDVTVCIGHVDLSNMSRRWARPCRGASRTSRPAKARR